MRRKLSGSVPKYKSKRTGSEKGLSAEEYKDLTAWVQDQHRMINENIGEASVRFRKTVPEVRRLVLGRGRSKVPPATAKKHDKLWQAYVHWRAMEINESLPVGSKKQIGELLPMIKLEDAQYRNTSQETKREWLEELDRFQNACQTQKRTNKKAEEMDVARICSGIGTEMSHLKLRTGVDSFFIASRTDALSTTQPVIICEDKVKEFFVFALGKSAEHIARLFEVWSIHGLMGVFASNSKNANDFKKEIRRIIQAGLDLILSAAGLVWGSTEMNYKSYLTMIVAKHGVKLVGWTYGDTICNPGEITRTADLKKLFDALVKKECRWEHATDEERANIQPSAPTTRSDKGVARGSYKKKAVDADGDVVMSDEDEDEDDANSSSSESEHDAPMHNKTGAKAKAEKLRAAGKAAKVAKAAGGASKKNKGAARAKSSTAAKKQPAGAQAAKPSRAKKTAATSAAS